MSKLKMMIQKDDARKTRVKRSEVGGAMNYWEITLAGITITIRDEAFDDLLQKMQAAKAEDDKRMEAARQRLIAQGILTPEKGQDEA